MKSTPTLASSAPSVIDSVRDYSAAEVSDLRVYTVKEVAAVLVVGVATVNRAIHRGDLVAFYPTGRGHGRPVRVLESSLRAFIESATA